MINKFNKLVENVFIPADEDEVVQRKVEHKQGIISKNLKNKAEVEAKYGPLESSDLLHFKNTDHCFIVQRTSFAENFVTDDINDEEFIGPCFTARLVARNRVKKDGPSKSYFLYNYERICSYLSLDVNDVNSSNYVEIIHVTEPKYQTTLGKLDDSSYNQDIKKLYKPEYRN